jgi:hypothetical protein
MDGLDEFIEWVKQREDDDLLVAWLRIIDSSPNPPASDRT